MNKYIVLLLSFTAGLAISAVRPHDYFTWFLEVLPAIIGLFILLFTFKHFTFTYFTYCLILVHAYILFVGGHYTYAEVPLFNWIQETFHQSRNNFDKVGHFAQGFVPAIIVREIFIRKQIITATNWLTFLCICVCLSISAMYEFFEWGIALITGDSSDAFLGTQGYVWDTQSDMLYAFCGACCATLLFRTIHDKAIQKLHQQSQLPL